MVRLHRRVAGLAVRHDGPAALQPGPKPAVRSLLHVAARRYRAWMPNVDWYGGIATTIFMIGWALGGIFFGILGDRIGRAKTMMLTVLVLLGLHGPERAFGGRLGLRLLSVPDRPGRRRPVRRRRRAGGRGHVGPGPAVRARAGSRRSRPSATCSRPAQALCSGKLEESGAHRAAPGGSCS